MWLLLGSISFNFIFGGLIYKNKNSVFLFVGVTLNIFLLVYFKYSNFFLEAITPITETTIPRVDIVLPLAISFFTFQQIAYLVDVYRGARAVDNYFDYALFVAFFPQLIAGPIVRHDEFFPQLAKSLKRSPRLLDIAVGVTIFTIGLFKKTILGDGLANYADPVFDAAATGASVNFLDSWVGVLAFTFQIYFDFSGYSDMAIGLARLFGIRLPINFYSPYKSLNISEFWRRWHISLSRFLLDYLYIPLGGNRGNALQTVGNLMIVMVLGGLW
ncbi:MAG: MBOAT family protein, partial [Magnetovibrio sp.]|nr:MBOAT family protein [Magnetovibrio sp.]